MRGVCIRHSVVRVSRTAAATSSLLPGSYLKQAISCMSANITSDVSGPIMMIDDRLACYPREDRLGSLPPPACIVLTAARRTADVDQRHPLDFHLSLFFLERAHSSSLFLFSPQTSEQLGSGEHPLTPTDSPQTDERFFSYRIFFV